MIPDHILVLCMSPLLQDLNIIEPSPQVISDLLSHVNPSNAKEKPMLLDHRIITHLSALLKMLLCDISQLIKS